MHQELFMIREKDLRKIIWGRKSEADCVYNEFDRESEYCD